MNSLYEKENLLSYVSKDDTPVVENKVSIFKPKQSKNGLATAAFITALCSILLGMLIFPSALGIALGVGALIVAVKRGLPKMMPVISIGISAATLLASLAGLLFVFSELTPDSEPYVPPSYTYDVTTGLAYKYNPISNIACDSKGECPLEVTIFRADTIDCLDGGWFAVSMEDLQRSLPLPSKAFEIPALEVGQQHSEKVVYQGIPNGRLVESINAQRITCN